MHHREHRRPSSSGQLIHRVMPESRLHVWHPGRPVASSQVRIKDRQVWILDPHGEPIPARVETESVQIVLLDGSWSEAAAMAKRVGTWGRRVSLPMTGETRYWLRDQQVGGRYSTVEALIFVLRALGLERAGDALREQLELHVYANLRMRGRKERADEFLQHSTARTTLVDVVDGRVGT